jgi:hypothetical protein
VDVLSPQLPTQGQISLRETLRALGSLATAFPAFPSWTAEAGYRPNEVLATALAACGISSVQTFQRFGRSLTCIPASNARECQAALERSAAGVWGSGVTGADTRVVFCERPIDALAYQESRSGATQTLVSLGKNLPADFRSALEKAIKALPADKTIVTAFANDYHGARLTASVRQMAAGRQVVSDRPVIGRTWCDTIIARQRDHIRARGLSPPGLRERG